MSSSARNTFGLLAMTLLLPACATVATPEYPRQHPANPDAIQAPAPAMSSALDGYRPANRKEQSGQPAAPVEPSSSAGPGNSAQQPDDGPAEDDHDHR